MIARDCIDVLSEVAEGLGYLTPVEPIAMPRPEEIEMVIAMTYHELSASTVEQRTGVVYVGFGLGLPRTLAVNMLGCPTRSGISDEVAREAALEMVNVLTGNLLPVVYGSNCEFRLSSPRAAAGLVNSGFQVAALATEEGVIAIVIQEAR